SHVLLLSFLRSRTPGMSRPGFRSQVTWIRRQINLAPADGDSNGRLIIACGKSNNGKEFQPFGVQLNNDTLIYEIDPTIDIAEWEKEMAGNAARAPLMNGARVGELCKALSTTNAQMLSFRPDAFTFNANPSTTTINSKNTERHI
ncbi:MAG TPA: hypothetical protein VGF13_01845, partial [Verrucomicrobiae bacterium]